MRYHALMAEPTTPSQEDIDLFNAEVQKHIDFQASLGNTISWEDGVKQFGNLLRNKAADPDLQTIEEKVAEHDQRLYDLELRVDNAGIPGSGD